MPALRLAPSGAAVAGAKRRTPNDTGAGLPAIHPFRASAQRWLSRPKALLALEFARQVDPQVPVVFFDSGLEFPETYTYLDQLTEAWRLNLHVVTARMSALEVLAANGGWDHWAWPASQAPNLHQVLIVEPAARAHQVFGPGELWGVRAAESRGRAAAYANALRDAVCNCDERCAGRERRARHGGRIARVDGTVAYSPMWDWHPSEVWGHIARRRLPVNPVYDKLRRLGAPEAFLRVSTMIDGTRLEKGRVTWLRRGWPALFEEVAGVLPRLREYV